jgi:hypothetical protein
MNIGHLARQVLSTIPWNTNVPITFPPTTTSIRDPHKLLTFTAYRVMLDEVLIAKLGLVNPAVDKSYFGWEIMPLLIQSVSLEKAQHQFFIFVLRYGFEPLIHISIDTLEIFEKFTVCAL